MNTNDTIKNDARFFKVKELLDKLFKTKGYQLNDYFDKKIWFLKEKSSINYFIRTPSEGSKSKFSFSKDDLILRTIKEISIEQQGTFSEDFYIPVNEFIKRITTIIISSQLTIENCKENLINYGSIEKVDLINVKRKKIDELLVLYEKNSNIKRSKTSNITFNISRTDCFPEGEYLFKLVINEFNDNLVMLNYSKSFEKKIKIIEPYQKINLLEMNLNKKDICFQSVDLIPLNQDNLKNYLLNGDKIRMRKISEQKRSPKKSQEKNKNDIKRESDPNFNNEFDLMSFELDFNENSGTNLFNFGIHIERNGQFFGCPQESFLDFLLLHTDELMNLESDYISTNYILTVKILEKYLEELKMPFTTVNLVLGIEIQLNLESKKNILDRLHSIFQANVTLLSFHEALICSMIDEYFKEISEPVHYNLSISPDSSSKGGCCEGCTIF